eukprot:m.139282 g.139282  ORF g.139282 m.139282 type:complete len:191 (+) comp11497_c0_seq14:99-671(+)
MSSTGTSFMSRLTYKRPPNARGAQRGDGREPYCQKCEKFGKWTYECKGADCKKEYKARPSRTKMLHNPKLIPEPMTRTIDKTDDKASGGGPNKKRRVNAEADTDSENDSDSSSSSSSSGSSSSSSSSSGSSGSSSSSSGSSDSDSSSSTGSSSSSSSSSSEGSSRKRKKKLTKRKEKSDKGSTVKEEKKA